MVVWREQNTISVYPALGPTTSQPWYLEPNSAQKKSSANTAELEQSVGVAGLEPATKGLCLPLRLSPPLSSSWSGLSLLFTSSPYSLYTFNNWSAPADAWLGISMFDTIDRTKPSPNLTNSTETPSMTNQQPN